MSEHLPIKRALISVSDKTGLVELCTALSKNGIEIISTGGSFKAIKEAGLNVIAVDSVTGFPEIMDGRVKTLHPKIHGGLLAKRGDRGHVDAASRHEIGFIDLLVVNLYPFEATIARGADHDEAIENIDIGGPAMIRAAAKNHADVAVLTDPSQYTDFLEALALGGTILPYRARLAQQAFAHTAAYDAVVSGWMADEFNIDVPPVVAAGARLKQELRYGENPHQVAAFYTHAGHRAVGVATAEQVQGKALSYNNINDTDAAFALISEFDPEDRAACAIIKHANPCGVATGDVLADAYSRAFDCDRTSAFGGIIALNQPLDADTAEKITDIFTEVVIAPGASDAAKAIFAQKQNLRLLLTDGLADPHSTGREWRQVSGGFLVQEVDRQQLHKDAVQIVTKRVPSETEMADLFFAWTVAKHVKSNAIVYAHGGRTVGIGAGQMSRIDSTRIATWKAKDAADVMALPSPLTEGSVVASDAFFPFPDGLIAAAEAGATAIIQPGGAMRDEDVIAAADEAGLAMVFTNMRHFKH
ncbi:MAG: bifunctional phosphoribosylaminoimidazolecarboxamide formyltransferase/IMP cyclohydrolase [Pseudomonadota bacterium]